MFPRISKASPLDINKVASFPISKLPTKLSIPRILAVLKVISCKAVSLSNPCAANVPA